ncbi:MAG: hypothetical protein SGJ19_07285 [Planctomycetia bacterium]|nr:hypothetical protein [Planctomycetia bacterium]
MPRIFAVVLLALLVLEPSPVVAQQAAAQQPGEKEPPEASLTEEQVRAELERLEVRLKNAPTTPALRRRGRNLFRSTVNLRSCGSGREMAGISSRLGSKNSAHART